MNKIIKSLCLLTAIGTISLVWSCNKFDIEKDRYFNLNYGTTQIAAVDNEFHTGHILDNYFKGMIKYDNGNQIELNIKFDHKVEKSDVEGLKNQSISFENSANPSVFLMQWLGFANFNYADTSSTDNSGYIKINEVHHVRQDSNNWGALEVYRLDGEISCQMLNMGDDFVGDATGDFYMEFFHMK